MSTTATASPVQPYTERPLPSRWTIASPTRGALVASVVVALVTLAAPVQASIFSGADSELSVGPEKIRCADVAPDSAAADRCRADGWTIRAALVVTPARVLVRSSLPACTVEDASGGPLPCAWNFPNVDTGDNRGRALYFTGHHRAPVAHFVTIGGRS